MSNIEGVCIGQNCEIETRCDEFECFVCFGTLILPLDFPTSLGITGVNPVGPRPRKSFDQALFQSLEASYDEHRAAWHRAHGPMASFRPVLASENLLQSGKSP